MKNETLKGFGPEAPRNNLVLDGMNFAYRAHSIFFESRTSSGDPSGMFYGFLKMLIPLRNKYRGYKFSVAWDNKSQRKYDLFPEYKSNRSQLSSRVFSQVNDIKNFLGSCNVDQYEKVGEEADDVIATIVENFKSCKGNIVIHSNDKDMLQLVEEGKVVVVRPKVGNTPEKIYDYGAVLEQYGVPPAKLPDFRSLDGDGSDTLPGVPQVRRSILASMVNSSSDLNDLYSNIIERTKLTKYALSAILGFKEQALVNYSIMKLERGLTSLDYRSGVVDEEIMKSLLDRYEVKSMLPESFKSLFNEEMNLRYTDPVSSNVKIETYSLFD